MAFVCKQMAVLVVRINNIGHSLPHTSAGQTSCIYIFFFSLKNVDPYDRYAACCVTLRFLVYLPLAKVNVKFYLPDHKIHCPKLNFLQKCTNVDIRTYEHRKGKVMYLYWDLFHAIT